MSEQEILEGNKLIAEWVGFKFNKERRAYCIPPMGFSFKGKLENLMFHSSWDWLVPVLKKIHSFPLDNNPGYILQISYLTFVWNEINIEELFKGIVKFINWYNSCQIEK